MFFVFILVHIVTPFGKTPLFQPMLCHLPKCPISGPSLCQFVIDNATNAWDNSTEDARKDYLCRKTFKMVYRQLSPEETEDLSSRILYEDNHLLVVNKRPGEIVQGDKTGDETLCDKYKAFIAWRDSKPGEVFLGIPHRLDRPVSGVTILSKTSKCLERMTAAFRDGTVHKTYWALVCAMPAKEEDALITLLLAGEASSEKNYNKYIADFIRMFPNSVDGYTARARKQLAEGNIEATENTMKEAISNATDKANAHFELSKIIYDKVIYNTDSTFTKWTLDNALSEIREAYNIKQDPSYKHHEARVIYTQGNYKEALDIFTSLTATPIRNSELFYEAAQCKQKLNAPHEEILEFLDSAITVCPQPITNISAHYFLARGEAKINAGQLRPALADYNKYDTLMMGNAAPEFYYNRHKLEISLKQYQQALNDIAHTILLSPREPFYIAEMATLYLKVNQPERAIKSCDLCISVDENFADAYIIKGLAQIQTKNKDEGLKNLEKARELGDGRAQGLIEKYK